MFKIIDLQGDNGFSLTEEKFKTRKAIIRRLADFHDCDYTGVMDNDDAYQNIYDFLYTLKDDKARLNWLCDYGSWDIIRVRR